MKSYGGLFDDIVSVPNLERAATVAARGKRDKPDVAGFFDSVDHTILLDLLGRTFREKRLLDLLAVTVRSSPSGAEGGKGLPIGNLTSQWFANLYLDGLDHHVKETMRTPGYIRYMDDMLLFSDSKAALWAAHDETAAWLERNRALTVKPAATVLAPCAEGIPFLGLRIFPGTWRLQRARFLRTRRRIRGRERAYLNGRLSSEQLALSAGAAQGILSWFGIKGILPERLEA